MMTAFYWSTGAWIVLLIFSVLGWRENQKLQRLSDASMEGWENAIQLADKANARYRQTLFFIAAKNAEHANSVARSLYLQPSEYRYLADGEMLRGIEHPLVVVYDTASENCNWAEIKQELAIRQARLLFFHEPVGARDR